MLLSTTLACVSMDGTGDSLGVEDGSDTNETTDAVHQTTGSLRLPDIASRNIVVLHVDTMRADHLVVYGYARNTLPRLSARPWLAVDGAVAASSWTLPSTTSFFTGLDIRHHDVRYVDQGTPNKWLTDTTFASRMGDAGYATAVFTGNVNVSVQTRITVGFDTEFSYGKSPTRDRINSVDLADNALRFVDALAEDTPFMLHLQPTDLHSPLAPPAAYAGTFTDEVPFHAEGSSAEGQENEIRSLLLQATDPAARQHIVDALNGVYDESMLGLDQGLESLIAGLDKRGLLADTLVILTADHGEELDDAHDATLGHGGNLREATTRIPLLILTPDLAPGVVTCRMRNYDIWPTIFSAAGLDMPSGLDGVDLALGCPESASSSLWDMSGKLMVVATNGARSKLQAECPAGGTRRGTNLDGAYNPSEDGDARTIFDPDAMEAAIASHISAIEADNGGSWRHNE